MVSTLSSLVLEGHTNSSIHSGQGLSLSFFLLFSVQAYLYQTFIGAFSPAVFGCNLLAQTELVKATTAIESAVFVTMQWLVSVKPSSGLLYTIAEELKSQVKKMGGFFQLLIQVNTEITTLY